MSSLVYLEKNFNSLLFHTAYAHIIYFYLHSSSPSRYNNFTLELLQKHVDFFDWTMYFSNVFKQINRTVSKKEPIIVYSFEYLTSLNAIIKEKLKSTEGKDAYIKD